ncbi:hypothetical protein [Streptomyces sp. NPDC004284]|uniref:hypothetical protein n=1 Tax=Streptomyces sp. NPDC004284 TaxID=3364695 RepID=UPI00368C7619
MTSALPSAGFGEAARPRTRPAGAVVSGQAADLAELLEAELLEAMVAPDSPESPAHIRQAMAAAAAQPEVPHRFTNAYADLRDWLLHPARTMYFLAAVAQ